MKTYYKKIIKIGQSLGVILDKPIVKGYEAGDEVDISQIKFRKHIPQKSERRKQ